MKGSRPFRLPAWSGEIAEGLVPEGELEAAIQLLTDPGRARETLHWGRNYLYTVELPGGGGAPGHDA